MASLLSKFVRGAATEGAALYADQYRQELQSKLMAKRDEVLQRNRMEMEKARSAAQAEESRVNREFRSDEAEEGRTFTAEQNDLNRTARAEEVTARKESPQNKIAEIELTRKQKINELQDQILAAKTPEEKDKLVEEIALRSGAIPGGKGSNKTANQSDVDAMVAAEYRPTKAAAWKVLKGKSGVYFGPALAMLERKNEDYLPGDPEYLTPLELVTQAKEIADRLANGKTEKPDPVFGPKELPKREDLITPKTIEEYQTKVPIGGYYIEPDDGRIYQRTE